MIQMEKVVICVENPEHIKLQNNELHSTTDYAIKWQDGTGMNFINGRYLEEDLFFKVLENKLTFDEFQKLDNEDIKAGIITLIKENEGNEGLIKFLDAIKVDEQIINHANNYSETMILYKTKSKYSFLKDSKGNTNVSYAWLSMNCPSTGSNYLIDTCPTFTDVLECAKWHRPNQINSKIPYFWQSAN